MKEKTSGQKMLLTAGFMAMATLLSKVLGLVRDSLLTAYFGSGLESDAFLTASTIPTTLFDVIIGGVISAAFIPVFNDIMSKKGKDEAMKFVNKFVTLIVCITLFIVVGGIIFRDVLVNIQAPNYTADKHNLAAQLTAIMFPMVIFTGLAFSFVGLLQSFGEYNIPSIISLVSNLAIILYYVVFGKKFGIYDVVMPFDSKIIMPLAYNKIRTYIAGQIYDANDTKETINKNSMVITVDADNQVLISAFDSENGLKVEMLSPSSDPNDGSYGYRNYYNPEEKQFYLYYRFDNGEGWKVVRETLRAESIISK